MVVVGGQLHEEIVGMLPVVDGVSLAHLPGCEKVEKAAITHGPRLCAAHRADTETSAAEGTPCHDHAPVHAAGLVIAGPSGAVTVAGLGNQLAEHVAVQHHAPAAPLPHCTRHRRQRR
jgi:hypothetical protein